MKFGWSLQRIGLFECDLSSQMMQLSVRSDKLLHRSPFLCKASLFSQHSSCWSYLWPSPGSAGPARVSVGLLARMQCWWHVCSWKHCWSWMEGAQHCLGYQGPSSPAVWFLVSQSLPLALLKKESSRMNSPACQNLSLIQSASAAWAAEKWSSWPCSSVRPGGEAAVPVTWMGGKAVARWNVCLELQIKTVCALRCTLEISLNSGFCAGWVEQLFLRVRRKSRLYHMQPCSFIPGAVGCQHWTLLLIHTLNTRLHHPEITGAFVVIFKQRGQPAQHSGVRTRSAQLEQRSRTLPSTRLPRWIGPSHSTERLQAKTCCRTLLLVGVPCWPHEAHWDVVSFWVMWVEERSPLPVTEDGMN